MEVNPLPRLEEIFTYEVTFGELPPDVQLAVVLSPATRIEPELIRSMRLAVLPRLDVSAESDLWFADWVGLHGPAGISLRPELLPALRHRLRRLLRDCPGGTPIHEVWAVLAAAHDASLTPLLRLEERITELALTGRDAEPELKRVLYSLTVEKRSGIADWAYGAWRRLPCEVLRTTTGWQLEQVVNGVLKPERVAAGEPPEGLRPEHVVQIAGALGRRELAFTRHGDRLLVGGEPTGESVVVEVPDTEPVLLGILADDGEHSVAVPARGGVWIDVPEDGFHGRLGDGRTVGIAVPPDTPVALAAADRLPGKLLARAERLAPDGWEADVAELTSWLGKGEPKAVRLLYSEPDRGLRQLAHALATIARRKGWAVLRPSATTGLTGRVPPGDVLVLVDDAAWWSPRELAALADGLPRSGRSRVLVLDRVASSWWEAVQHFLGRIAVSQQRVRPPGSASPAVAASVDAFCRMLGLPSRPALPRLPNADSAPEVHLAALLAVLRGSPAPAGRVDDLAAMVLERESAMWSTSAADRWSMASAALVATLAFPLPRAEAAGLLVRLRVVRDFEDADRLLAAYEQWYPSPRTLARPGPGYLTEAIPRLALGPGCLGLPAENAHALVSRLLADESGPARRAAGALMLALPSSPVLKEAVLASPGLVRGSPGAVAAEFVARAGPEVLERLSAAGGRGNPLVVALVLERLTRPSGERPPDEQLRRRLELAGRLAAAGLVQRAVEVLTDVVRKARLRATVHPATYRTFLLAALAAFSTHLLAAGRQAEAVKTAQEAVRLSKEMDRADLTVHQRHLAHVLLRYSTELVEQGRAQGAAEATAEAVRIHQDLRTLGEGRYEPELASALFEHARVLAGIDRRAEAVPAARESVAVFHGLADRLAAAYEGPLAEAQRLLADLER